jgi:tripartite-type tricarboxylate transporter receptor subunit TctC
LDLGSWWGLFVPVGTPEPVVAKINAAVQTIMGRSDFRQRLAKMNIVADTGTPEAMAGRLKSETEGWSRVIRSANIELQ